MPFLNSFRRFNPDVPLCLIPFADDVEGLTALRERHRFSVFTDIDLLRTCEAIGLELRGKALGHYRKLVMWEGPFEEFVYIDSDAIVLHGIDFAFELLADYGFVTAHGDDPLIREHVWNDSVYGAGVLTWKQIAFSGATGFIASRRDCLRLDDVLDRLPQAAELLPHMCPHVVDQPLLNYLMVTSGHRYASLFGLTRAGVEHLPLERSAEAVLGVVRDGQLVSADRCPTLMVHWSGPVKESTDTSHLEALREFYRNRPATPDDAPDDAGTSCTFEDGSRQGWRPREGGESCVVTTADAHTGTSSLLVTGRATCWAGPVKALEAEPVGSTCRFAVWVKLTPGEPASRLRLSIGRHLAGTAEFDQVTKTAVVTPDAWVELAGTYTVAHPVDFLSLYVESTSGTASFYLDDFTMRRLPRPSIEADIPSLKDVLAACFPFGTAIGTHQIVADHAELVLKHCASVTVGNALKWDAVEPAEGHHRWTDADAQIGFAGANGLAVRGHTLVWHEQTPAWVFRDDTGAELLPAPENKQLLLRRLENHIRAVMGRYAGRISAWDVVNEVIDETEPEGLRRSPWYDLTGLDYIRTAFAVARETDPAAKLYLNEYDTTRPARRRRLAALVHRLRSEGVPIDGIGHQMHIAVDQPTATDIEDTLRTFTELGLDNQITELDVSPRPTGGGAAVSAEEQGRRYGEVFVTFRLLCGHISSVTVWGLADNPDNLCTFPHTGTDNPLIFDERLQAKPAFWAIAAT
ncbi:endo-1,4-beta-xylanase [Allokutzneria oryzae]|uniref:Beta-xylanase n=1 Tax=Allokutzneria oryzae TaxID=1378989 RepID=A0ABV6A9X8_9PSEU